MTHVKSVRLWYYLVGGWALPIWKMMEFVSWDDDIPNMIEKYKRFQTTNQWYIYIYMWMIMGGWLWMYMGYSGNDATILSQKTTRSMQPVSFCINWWSDLKIISWSPSHLVFPGSLDWHQFDSGPLHVSLGQGDTCRWPSRGLPKGLKMGPLIPKLQVPLW